VKENRKKNSAPACTRAQAGGFAIQRLVTGVRGAFDAIRDAKDDEAQFEQEPNHERADEKSDDSHDQVGQSLRRGLLIAEHDAGHDGDSSEEDGDDVKQFHKTAKERLTKGEIKKSGEKILIIGHAASSKEIRTESWTET
jgi:hypothetical protein